MRRIDASPVRDVMAGTLMSGSEAGFILLTRQTAFSSKEGVRMIARIILNGVLVLVLLSTAFSVCAEDNPVETLKEMKTGGPCSYKEYKGRAQITAISQGDDSAAGTYEVKFLFHPDEEITEAFAAKAQAREFNLHTKRGTNPRMTYIRKNGIAVGGEHDCVLNVIVHGTCTPMIFQFPSFND
jgi:hypothetical protein